MYLTNLLSTDYVLGTVLATGEMVNLKFLLYLIGVGRTMQSQSSRSKAGPGSRPMKECLTWIMASESKSTEDTVPHLVKQRGGRLQ